MTLFTILAASTSPVSLEQMMAQLRLDETADAEQLERLEEMIADAAQYIGDQTGLTLAPTDFEQRLDCWPAGRCVPLLAGPVRGVDEVAYVDEDDVERVLDADQYQLVLVRRHEAELVFAEGFSAPALANWPGAVRIRFAAGFNDPGATGSEGEDRLELPGKARQALIVLAATWFKDRLAIEPEAVTRAIPHLRVYR